MDDEMIKKLDRKRIRSCARNYLNHLVSCKRSQMSIFIIIGVLLVGLVALFFLMRQGVIPSIGKSPETNPNSFLETCMNDKIKETIGILLSQGGYITNPLNKKFKFEGEKDYSYISYLCYNQNYYLPCINQEPMLIQNIKKETKQYISKDIELCFNDLTSNLNKEGYVVDARYGGFDVDISQNKMTISIDGKLTLTKTDETKKIEKFKISFLTRLYDLAVVSQEIVSQEARFCNFEHLGYMLFYPEFKIDKFRTGDSIIIYNIQHRDSKEKFRFAVRGCVIPPGI